MRRSNNRVLVACALACWVGCDDGAPPAGADAAVADAASDDARAPDAARDDARVTDAAPPTDAAIPRDGSPVDAAPPDDGTPPDAAPPPDGTPTDAAPPPDGTPADAAPPRDGGPDDAAPVVDAALPPDAAVGDECEGHSDCLDFRPCVRGFCVREPGPSPLAESVLLNEILVDGATDDDANGDGDIDATDDEFVEILNVGDAPADLSGCLLVESDLQGLPRHTFPAGFELPAGEAVVVFGGGAPSDALEATPGAVFAVANAADPAFSNGLNLGDAGDVLRLLDPDRREVFVFAYGDGCAGEACQPVVSDRSLTRAPDGAGAFVPHDEAEPGVVFSPGTRADGSAFR